MQNKQAIVGIVAAIVILLGAGALITVNKNSQPNNTVSSAKPTPNNLTQSTVAGIFATKENRKCEFETKSEGGNTKGTIYVSGNNAYGEFNLVSSDNTQKMYLIRDNNTFYIWGSELPQGMKMTMSVEDLSKQISDSQFSGLNASEKTNFNCVGWTVDNSKFTPPSNIKFLEVGKISAPTGVSPKTTNSPTSSCSLCNSLTGAAKQACLSGLNCQ